MVKADRWASCGLARTRSRLLPTSRTRRWRPGARRNRSAARRRNVRPSMLTVSTNPRRNSAHPATPRSGSDQRAWYRASRAASRSTRVSRRGSPGGMRARATWTRMNSPRGSPRSSSQSAKMSRGASSSGSAQTRSRNAASSGPIVKLRTRNPEWSAAPHSQFTAPCFPEPFTPSYDNGRRYASAAPSRTMSDPAIRVDNLVKKYGPVLAVDHIHFAVAPGELVGFLGPNGAGKSTTMRILTTFLPATSGIATVCGFDVMNDSMKVRQNIGYLPESVPLYPEMRVEEYLTYRAKLKNVDRSTRRARVEMCLERCRVKEVRRRLLGTLSKGYRQRVGLADAMIADPKVLILDEPTSGLDPIQIRQTLETIKGLAGTHTVLLSTHILNEVEAICDRVIIISRGTIRWDGRLTRLAEQVPVLILEARGPAEELRKVLEQQAGVKKVTDRPLDDGVTVFEIEQERGQDLREAVGKKVFEKGYAIRRLDLRRKNLEALYTDVVLSRDAGAA